MLTGTPGPGGVSVSTCTAGAPPLGRHQRIGRVVASAARRGALTPASRRARRLGGDHDRAEGDDCEEGEA